MKRSLVLMVCAVLLCQAAVFAAAETDSVRIGSAGASTVTVAMHDGVTADILLPQGSISRDQAASAFLEAAEERGGLLAAVNGGFFNAYYERSPEEGYGKAARCQVNLIREGRVINGGAGDQSAVYLGFTADGRALIDEVGVTLYVEFAGRKLPTWGVNYYYLPAALHPRGGRGPPRSRQRQGGEDRRRQGDGDPGLRKDGLRARHLLLCLLQEPARPAALRR